MKRVIIKAFLDQENPIVDVRSPSEFDNGHIPRAISIPLFSDEERAEVGTIYKQKSKQVAVKRGLEIVGPKMVRFIEEIEKLDTKAVSIYCWRGGMRSESMAWLFEKYGLEMTVLSRGYKAYRNHVISFFEQKLPLKVISGYTGSKKTELLKLIKIQGGQIVDLEGLANHQGSSFGNQKSNWQPTTEQFQNLLYEEFSKLHLDMPIWIEDECMNIGRVRLVEALYQQKNESPHFFLDIHSTERLDFLIEDYGDLTSAQLTTATNAISKKLGTEKALQAVEFINQEELRKAAEIILTYYDKQYAKSISKKSDLIEGHYKINMSEIDGLAKDLASINSNAIQIN